MMPPHKQPLRLQDIVITNVIRLLCSVSYNIQTRFGSYDEELCQIAITHLQKQFLLPKIWPFLDEICEKINYDELNFDKRIIFDMVVHKKTRVFKLPNTFPSYHHSDLLEVPFCVNQLSKLVNVVKLNICNRFISVQALQVIGSTCKTTLQEICITPPLTSFRESAIVHLSNCKELRRVNILSACNDGSCKENIGYFKILIASLLKLEHVECDFLATVLSEIGLDRSTPLLRLKEIRETNITVQKILDVIRLCPFVNEIDLTPNCFMFEEKILEILSESPLKLETLILRKFSLVIASHWRLLLLAQGKNLRKIEIYDPSLSLTMNDIITIGNACPNLIMLGLDVSMYSTSTTSEVHPNNNLTDLYKNLESLHYGSYNFKTDNKRNLTFILSRAHHLRELKLLCNTVSSNQDVVREVLNLGSFKKLETLSLIVDGCGMITGKSLRSLIARCRKLQSLYLFGSRTNHAHAYLQTLYGRILDENLDLKVDVFHA